ncbi:MAG: TolC family outer membrane protein [Sphingomonas fennica]
MILRRPAALLAVLLAAPAAAETLQDALARTYATNPDLTAERADLRAIDEGAAIARADNRLQVTGVAGVTQGFNGIGTLNQNGRSLTGGLELAYPLFNAGRVRNAVRAADARVAVGRADLRTTEGNVFTTAVGAYMDVIRDVSIASLNAGQVRVLETNLEATRDRFQVGDLTVTDVAQSEARLANARSQLAIAQGRLTASREAYRRIIGQWPGDLAPPPPLPRLPATPDEAVAIAEGNTPSLAAIGAGVQAAQYDVRVARAARLPTLSAVTGANYNNYLGTLNRAVGAPAGVQLDQVQTNSTIGLQVRMPLYQGGAAGARIRQAQAREQQALEQGVGIERQVIATARAAFASFRAAGETIAASEAAVSANRLALEGARAEQGVGLRQILDVLNAEQELLNSQVTLVTARRDQYVAGFALLNAMGRAEMGALDLESGALYDPVSNYRRSTGSLSDWRESRGAGPQATRTLGPTPAEPAPSPSIGGTPADAVPRAPSPPVTRPPN